MNDKSSSPSATNSAPSAIYVWLVPSEHVLEQPGSWRIRKWDTAPFPEANYTLSEIGPIVEAWSEMTPRERAAYNKGVESAMLKTSFPSATPCSQWIPVGERMPGNYATVLIVDGDGISSTGFWNGSRWFVDVCDGTGDPYLTPTHWMPLPEKP